jgi:hypothetical protein
MILLAEWERRRGKGKKKANGRANGKAVGAYQCLGHCAGEQGIARMHRVHEVRQLAFLHRPVATLRVSDAQRQTGTWEWA